MTMTPTSPGLADEGAGDVGPHVVGEVSACADDLIDGVGHRRDGGFREGGKDGIGGCRGLGHGGLLRDGRRGCRHHGQHRDEREGCGRGASD
jgi:hypothetical protein